MKFVRLPHHALFPDPGRRAVLLAACASLLAMPAAQATTPVAAQGRVLRVVATHFAQVYEAGADGVIGGMGAELVRIIAAQLGYTVDCGLYPWARAQQMIKQGEADILVGPYKTAERQLTMAFSSRALFEDQLVFYALADSQIGWDGNYQSLAGQRIVILNGWAYGAAFDQARRSLLLSVSNSVQNGLDMLRYRRVELFASDRRDTDPLLAAQGLQGKVVALSPPIDTELAYLAFPRLAAFDALRIQFDLALQTMAQRGDLHKLGRRYGLSVP